MTPISPISTKFTSYTCFTCSICFISFSCSPCFNLFYMLHQLQQFQHNHLIHLLHIVHMSTCFTCCTCLTCFNSLNSFTCFTYDTYFICFSWSRCFTRFCLVWFSWQGGAYRPGVEKVCHPTDRPSKWMDKQPPADRAISAQLGLTYARTKLSNINLIAKFSPGPIHANQGIGIKLVGYDLVWECMCEHFKVWEYKNERVTVKKCDSVKVWVCEYRYMIVSVCVCGWDCDSMVCKCEGTIWECEKVRVYDCVTMRV